MSVENIEKFYALAFKDPSIIEALKNITDEKTYLSKVVALGAEHECSFTVEDARVWFKEMAARSANGEMDDLQLDAVAGGIGLGGGCFPTPIWDKLPVYHTCEIKPGQGLHTNVTIGTV